uniref:Uncharacterized protein n=1 Tax=Gopherus agassizii TaxID=38772 RepID=A0A452HSJ4_9SAUR
MQSEREYKKDFEKWKTKFNMPVDMLGFLLAKKCQSLVSDVDYRRILHQWTSLPDQTSIIQAKKVYELQSDVRNLVSLWSRNDIFSCSSSNTDHNLQWLKGLGWIPSGSLEAEKNKKASEILSEKKYRQPPDTVKFTSIPDAMDIVLAKSNAKNRSDRLYREAWDKDKTHIHIMPDTPEILLAKANLINTSDKLYKLGYEELKKKGYELPHDAISLKSAKASRDIASEYKYKEGYRKQLGHHVGARNIQDDPKMVWSMHVAKIQSDREYKKDFEKWKTKYNSPVDMLGVVLAKKCQELVSDIDYRHPLHKWTCLPDQNNVVHARKTYDLQSDLLYKSDLQWMRGIGWSPVGSLDDEKNKRATHILSDHSYRQHPDTIKFNSLLDSLPMVLAKHNSEIMNQRSYTAAWNKDKTSIHVMPDTPDIVLAQQNKLNYSEKLYRLAMEEDKKKGYDLRVDAIPIRTAKASRDIASEYKYKEGYRKQLGHHVGARNIQDDPKMVWSMHVAKIQSDREYKKDFEKWKTKYNTPVDMLGIVLAKKCQELVSEVDYRHPLHQWTCLPDQNDVVHARKTYDLQSDNKLNYSEVGDKLYRLAMEEDKKKGYDLRVDAIPIRTAKASRDIASEYKYKEGYRKQLGHHVGARNIQDDPKMVWSMHVAKIQSDREYKKDFEKWKTKYNTPVDMLGIVLAKKCQELVSEVDYRHPLHQWTCLPDQNDVVHARKTYDLQSDLLYKSDLQWMRGIGWSPTGSLDDEKNKRATHILSDHSYRQHPDTIKFNSLLDSLPMVLAKHNSEIMNQRSYTAAWNKDKTSIHVMPDTPDIVLAQQNKLNYSEKLYRLAMEEDKKKGYDLRVDAIPIRTAKASRDIASEYKYKEGYRKQLGHHVGARNIQDDPKMVWSMHVAKIQSDREYKKDFEKWKTKHNTPADMLGIVLAKKCQELVSEVDYRHPLHQWTCLPDQNDVVHARKTYDLQSDLLYKSDLQWMRGIGWSPVGSLDDEKNKRASHILSDHIYRQHPDTIKFTSLLDSLPMVLAKQNSEIMNQRSYTAAWNKDKTSIHVMPDTPDIVLAQQNKLNYSEKLYRLAMEEDKKKGYDLRVDAIPIRTAKASRDIASEYKYKEGYRKQLGHHVGARNIQDDPKMVWSMHVAKIQSDREYKKDFEKWKTKYNTPVDMLGIVLAKKCQELVSEVDYRHPLHQWTCLPDQNDVVHARKTYDLQSDVVYKSDLQWMRGIGWSPVGSLDDEKNKRAAHILSDHIYRQHPDTIKFNSLLDSLPMVLAKHNSEIMNQRSYTAAWNKDKTSIHVMPDTPDIVLAQQNKLNYSEKLYRLAMEEDKKKGYDLRVDAIPIRTAKASRDIASEYKYKEGYRKQLGHHVGARNIQDDPKMMWSMHVARIQSDREYKKDFEKWKTKYNSPVDMLGIVLAKKCQELVSEVDYRHPLHQWTCLPDQNDVIHARKAYELQSDNCYKSDLQWLRGIGWVPIGSLDVEKAKKAGEILSDNIYRQPPDKFKFTSVTDSLEMVLAKHNAEAMNKRLYTEAWDKDKTEIHMMPDTPEIMLARQNKVNYSQSLYKLAMEEAKKRGCDLRIDAIPIKTARASRDIASDYKYKEGYRKQLGHHIGARNIQDDPKMVWSMHVAKIQSDREYKKDFEKWKTKYNSPVDMLGIVMAKKCQELVSDIDYRHPLHQWTCLPDQNDVIHARKAYDLQSDNYYKSDLQWLRGIGWVPIGSLDVEKAKKAGEILSDKIYRQPPDTFKFTSVTDSLEMVLAKNNAETMNKRLYTEAWDKDKTTIHVMPDTPEIMLAKLNQINCSEKLYKLALEELKKRGCDLRVDAIPIQAAKASRNIASEYKYKEGYRKQLGHHVGARNIQDDPKMMWSMHVAKIQSDREYKKDFEKSKTNYTSPVDMLGIVQAKTCQTLVSDVDYRHYLHQWTCLPDQNDVIQAKKAYELQSDAVYKSDLEWLKGTGWVPIGSIDVEKVKRAGEILSEKQYRQPPDQIKFTSVTDSLELVLAKQNAETMNKRLYTEAWNADKSTIHVMPDTPEILLAKANSANVSQKLYTQGWEESKMRDYDIRADAIPIRSAKASRDIASEYKYKEAYEKQRGHHIGARTIRDDPKMMWSMHAAKIQSDREYKKYFEKSKTRYTSPVDMLGIVQAKKCQELVSDVDYRHYLHQWTCLPDQNDVIQAKKAYELQSDNVYKSDLEWLRGIGWMPDGSVDVDRVKKAQELLNERLYRQRPDTLKFTSIVDPLPVVLAKINSKQISEPLYREAWNKEKIQFTLPADTPQMMQSKVNALNISNKHYQQAWEDAKMKDYDLRADAISIKHARASRDIASEYKYKETHEKQKGHYIGCRTAKEDPKLSWAAHVMRMQNDREYRKAYHSSKARVTIPVDMVSVQAAKQCQSFVSEVDYRQYLHQWTCLPDQNDVIQARKAYDLQSDNVYKSDLEWLRGIGWMPDGSVDVDRVKKAQELLNNRLYRTRPDELKFTSIVDTPEIVLAKTNSLNQSGALYREVWDKEKTQFTLPSDTPEMLQSRINALNISKYKYKTGYRQQLGHYVGFQSLQDDPKLVWSIHAAKIQSDREYKKYFEKSKTKYTSPVDMLGIVQAKKCQTLVSDVDYRNYLHQWTCLPDQNDVIQAKKAYELQSDNVYKSDLEWLRGTGWLTQGCVDVTRVKKAQELVNDRLYRLRPDELKFTSVVDPPPVVLAKINALQISEVRWPLYNHIFSIFTLIFLWIFLLSWEDAKMKDYDLKADAISIKHARASRDIASEYKYKETHEKQKGHYIGCRTAKEDPKLSWAAHVMRMQNDREYRKAYHSSKARVTIPVDMVSVQAAKQCQSFVSEVDYRQYLHQWTCLPDQNDVIQARKAYDLQIGDAPFSFLHQLFSGCIHFFSPQMWVLAVNSHSYKYKETHEKQKGHYIGCRTAKEDPKLSWAAHVMRMQNDREYKKAYHSSKAKINIPVDMVSVYAAKEGQLLASDVDYRQYLHQWTCLPDQNDVIQARKAYDLQSDVSRSVQYVQVGDAPLVTALYKSDLEWLRGIGWMPSGSVEVKRVKNAQDILSEKMYRTPVESLKYTNIVDTPDVLLAKTNAVQISLVFIYILTWDKAKTTIHVMPDTPEINLARANAIHVSNVSIYIGFLYLLNFKILKEIASDYKYKLDHETQRGHYVGTPTAREDNKIRWALHAAKLHSDLEYRKHFQKWKTKCSIPVDMLPIVAAKKCQTLVSDIDYRNYLHRWTCLPDQNDVIQAKKAYQLQNHETQRGHYVGTPTAREDNKIRWALHAAKLHSDLEYRKHFQKWKTKCSIPVDMLPIVAAKKCQTLVSDIDYRNYLHRWTCLPDQNDVIQAKKAYQLQSDVS